MKLFLALALAFNLFACGQTFEQTSSVMDRSPTGEKGVYIVNPARTMKQVKSGTFNTVVGENVNGFYPITVDYVLQIVILGRKTGTKSMSISADYWTNAFWENLRATKHYENAQFKLDYLGAKIVTVNNKTYNCDYVKVYDIKDPEGATDLSQITMLASISINQIPAFGAAQVDISGRAENMDIVVGADYLAR